MDLRTDDFDYELPPEWIAQTPVEPRDSSRLLVVHRDTTALDHRIFRDIVEYLRPGDLLVANDSRVLPGRLWARKSTGGRVELLLLRPLEDGWWEALGPPAHRLRPGQRLTLEESPTSAPVARGLVPRSDNSPSGVAASQSATTPHSSVLSSHSVAIGARTPSGALQIHFDAPVDDIVARYGTVPLPPYIHAPLADPERYQTVYSRVTGSAAAPTAGLHFTPQLLDRIATMGVRLAFVTLHVGTDTFRPVQAERIVDHEMHSEFVSVPDDTAQAIAAAKRDGRRVIAIGTTAVRSLESWAAEVISGQWSVVREGGSERGQVNWPLPTDRGTRWRHWSEPAGRPLGWSGWTRLFIYPGYQFRVVDAPLTNFHLPRSTLLMLVSAFAGREAILEAYAEALREGYLFYSFGDAMLLI